MIYFAVVKKTIKKLIPQTVFQRIEPYGHLLEAVMVQGRAGFPARKLQVIGVTGTDGKSTTCSLILHLLRANGYKVAMITTISVDFGDGRGEQPNPSGMTTPGVATLARLIDQIRRNDVEWLVLETASHALAQHRVWSIPFSVAVMTNISHEHLDYHGTFERYRDAKRQLFKLCSRNKQGLQVGVINADDSNAEYFIKDTIHPLTYGLSNGDVQASNIQTTNEGSHFTVNIKDQHYDIRCRLPGSFNIYNCLAAVGVGYALGLTQPQIEAGIAAMKNPPGRMELVKTGQAFDVIIDYAVTPNALETVLKDLRSRTQGRILLVFGATGDRDKLKRPIMGQIAAKEADLIFLTDDETYTEDPDTIRAAVYKGIANANGKAKTQQVADRQQAIEQALATAKNNDVVLITGLGHQTTRNMGGHKQPWDEKNIILNFIKEQLMT